MRSSMRHAVRRSPGPVLVAAIVSMVVGLVFAPNARANADNFDGTSAWFNDDANIASSLPDWMSGLPPETNLGELSIPGTHDTMALHNAYLGFAQAQTQSLTLIAQLNAGIRYIDIRGQCNEDQTSKTYSFALYHGIIDQGADFQADVLDVLQEFLAAHPSETVMMRFSHDGITDPDQSIQCVDGGYNAAVNYVMSQNPTLFWGNPYGPNPVAFSSNTPAPTLGDSAGKVVFLQGFGNPGPNPGAAPYDQFGVYVDWPAPADEPQWNSVDAYDNRSDVIWAGDASHITQASTAIFNGRDVGPRNQTLYLTGLNGNVAVANPPTINAMNVNLSAQDWLLAGHAFGTGILDLDFAGPGIIAIIVAHNFNLLPPGGAAAQCVDSGCTNVTQVNAEILNVLRTLIPYDNQDSAGNIYGDDGGAERLSERAYSFLSAVMYFQNVNTVAWNTDGAIAITNPSFASSDVVHYSYAKSYYEYAWADPFGSSLDNWQSYFSDSVLPAVSTGNVGAMRDALNSRFPDSAFDVFGHRDPGGGQNWWLQTKTNISQGEFHDTKHDVSYFVIAYRASDGLTGAPGARHVLTLGHISAQGPPPSSSPSAPSSGVPPLAVTGGSVRPTFLAGLSMLLVGIVVLLGATRRMGAHSSKPARRRTP